jgi:hypothetical protein
MKTTIVSNSSRDVDYIIIINLKVYKTLSILKYLLNLPLLLLVLNHLVPLLGQQLKLHLLLLHQSLLILLLHIACH